MEIAYFSRGKLIPGCLFSSLVTAFACRSLGARHRSGREQPAGSCSVGLMPSTCWIGAIVRFSINSNRYISRRTLCLFAWNDLLSRYLRAFTRRIFIVDSSQCKYRRTHFQKHYFQVRAPILAHPDRRYQRNSSDFILPDSLNSIGLQIQAIFGATI